MSKNIKAENLTISVPNKGCNKNCPYCVSRMTGYIDENSELIFRNIQKVLKIAEIAEVSSILLTGKGEPLLNDSLEFIAEFCKYTKNWPIELQTNGICLLQKPDLIHYLYDLGINVIAVSIDNNNQLTQMKEVFKNIYHKGMLCRMTLNITNLLEINNFSELLDYCYQNNVSQLSLRKIVVPEGPNDNSVVKWIEENVDESSYTRLLTTSNQYLSKEGKLIRTTTDGITIWDCHGVSFAHIDYCIQERNQSNNIRSLIFAEDGHLYTSWNSKASALF